MHGMVHKVSAETACRVLPLTTIVIPCGEAPAGGTTMLALALSMISGNIANQLSCKELRQQTMHGVDHMISISQI
jgi:hypothetical protein